MLCVFFLSGLHYFTEEHETEGASSEEGKNNVLAHLSVLLVQGQPQNDRGCYSLKDNHCNVPVTDLVLQGIYVCGAQYYVLVYGTLFVCINHGFSELCCGGIYLHYHYVKALLRASVWMDTTLFVFQLTQDVPIL